MTKKKRYRRYSPEFKRQALKRASEEGMTDILRIAFLKPQSCPLLTLVDQRTINVQ